jgi:HEAT repeat protein
LVLLLPAILLLLGTLRPGLPVKSQMLLYVGTAFQILVCYLCCRSRRGWRQSTGPSILLLYLTGLGWLGLGLGVSDLDDWYLYFAQAILLIISLVVFALQILLDSGAPERRRAQLLAYRLANRKDWPSDLAACRSLPEVKALREALHLDATPALSLLSHGRPQVRVAALAALEFRKQWRSGQAQMVLQVAQKSTEPAIRAAAVTALANVDDRLLVEQLAEFLRDSMWEVRRATQEALLWDIGTRWPWIRHTVRRALADNLFAEDGPLLPSGQLLTAEAAADLTAWAAEKGQLAIRSALTLGVHYDRVLHELPDHTLIEDLCRQLGDPHSPAALRLELAHLLQSNQLLSPDLQEKMIDPLNPAPLRLIAAEALLESNSIHPGAVAALRDVARLPNREIALTTAGVVQRILGVDLGLAPGQPVPPLHSRQAAEVTRRVMMWAAQNDPAELAAGT